MKVPDHGRRWLRWAYVYGAAVALLVGYFLMAIPIQVSDCFPDLVSLEQRVGDLLRGSVSGQSFFRPGRWIAAKLVYEASGGEYHYAFRLVHVLHVVALVLLFVHLVRPRTLTAFAVLPLALGVLIGHHTFAGTLREAFPINHYLTVVVACVAAAAVSFGAYRRWNDLVAVTLFVAAASTLESGVLVWVVVAGGYVVGLRGVSWRGVAGVTAALAIYGLLRWVMLDMGLPGLQDRESGFGFERYDGADLQEMFGANPLPFYAYNVMASIMTVLVGEPRDGVFGMVEGMFRTGIEAPYVVGIVASGLGTSVIGHFTWTRRAAWSRGRLDRDVQIVAVFWMVFAANAAMGYAYTKDVILAPAGVFFAAALFVAVRSLVEGGSQGHVRASSLVVLLALTTTWAIRTVGVHASLVATAHDVREQWAYMDDWIDRVHYEMSPHAVALREQLEADAFVRHPPTPPLRERWTWPFEIE